MPRLKSYGPNATEAAKVLDIGTAPGRAWYKSSFEPDVSFECNLRCMQCQYVGPKGQCKRQSCRSLPYCWQHMITVYKVRLGQTKLESNGQRYKFVGLFACDPKQPADAVIFQKNQEIVPYVGELVGDQELNDRYGQGPASHAIRSRGKNYDAACFRGIASSANTAVGRDRKLLNAEFRETRPLPTIVATKRIKNGQEIFVNYGDSYAFGNAETKRVGYKLKGCKTK